MQRQNYIAIAVHGSMGSGKSTLIRALQECFDEESCLAIEEHERIATTSCYDPSVENEELKKYFWQRQTAIELRQPRLLKYSIFITFCCALLIKYFISLSIWIWGLILFLLFASFSMSIITHWLSQVFLSKAWIYNTLQFERCYRRILSRTERINWICYDRNCADMHAFCLLMNNVESVPENFVRLLEEQVQSISVAVFLDIPRHLIDAHLKARINSPTITRSVSFVTRLFIFLEYPIQMTIDSLKFIEQWYNYYSVPIIRLSEIQSKLEVNTNTGDIRWTKTSIDALLSEIIRIAGLRHEKKQMPTTNHGNGVDFNDPTFLPWKTKRGLRLYRI